MAHRPIGRTRAGALITIGSVASEGLLGTYTNLEHHAANIKPLVESLLPMVDSLRVREWRQFNNVHYLCTHDGRYFYFRPIRIAGKYVGLEFGQRIDKSEHNSALRIPLYNYSSVDQLQPFWQLIAAITEHVRGVHVTNSFDIPECAEA